MAKKSNGVMRSEDKAVLLPQLSDNENPAPPSGYRERSLKSPPFGFYPYFVIQRASALTKTATS